MAREFPTAPKDSFFVANQSDVAKATRSNAVGAFLVQTDGTRPAVVAASGLALGLGFHRRLRPAARRARRPWSYLTAVVGLTAVAVAAAGAGALRALNRPAVEELRDL